MDGIRTFSTSPVEEELRPRPCPLCGGSSADRSWKAQGVVFLRCASCAFWRQDPQPVPEAVRRRYGEEYLAYETERQLEYRAIALRSLSECGLRPDAPPSPGARLLEVGCATGALLSSFSDGGWDVTGVEVGESMAEYGRRRWNLDVRSGTLEEAGFGAGSFDTAVATHLIEHLNEPRAFLAELRRVLRPGAPLFLITPNADSLQAVLMGSRWRSAIRDHLYLFSRRTLDAMLAAEGFRTERVLTWGGWPAGMRPRALKRPLDGLAKLAGIGDVMAVRARVR